MTEWISIKDRVPGDDPEYSCEKDYLITDGINISIGWYEKECGYPIGSLRHTEECWNDHAELLDQNTFYGFPEVTHWMELPELPKV